MTYDECMSWTIQDRKPNGYYAGAKCIGEDCDAKIIAKGMCFKHYQRMRFHGRLDLVEKEPFTCKASHDGPCGDTNVGYGYCSKHYNRYKKWGDPLYLAKNNKVKVFCKVAGCGRKVGRGHGDGVNHRGSTAKQLCSGHEARLRLKGDVMADVPLLNQWMGPDSERPLKVCEVDGCNRTNRTGDVRGNDTMCNMHRLRMQRHGTLEKCYSKRLRIADNGPAVVYLLTDRQGSVKIGIASKRNSKNRLARHKVLGWSLYRVWSVTAKEAWHVEGNVLRWWRRELKAKASRSRESMPQGGWTETASTRKVGLRRTADRIDELVKIKK